MININDLPKSAKKFNCVTYAHDTTLSTTTQTFAVTDPTENVDHLINIELSNIHSWLNTKIHSAQNAKQIVNHMRLYINGVEIEKVQYYNLLGLTLNEKMNWGNISNKFSNFVCLITE